MRKSKKKLQANDLRRFQDSEPALFRELAGIICPLGILPEKELHECWQMAQIVHEAFSEVSHIADVAAGNGLLSWMLVLLASTDRRPVSRTAVCVDINRSQAARILSEAFEEHWPDLRQAVCFVEGSVESIVASRRDEVLFVANHACGGLSDRVLQAAISSGSSVAIMPCCHSLRNQMRSLGALAALTGLPLERVSPSVDSIDQFRADALRACGYEVRESFISPEITPYNRVLLGTSPESAPAQSIAETPQIKGSRSRRGEIRAYERVEALDVTNRADVRRFSEEPTREWRRFFDLSIWMDEKGNEANLFASLRGLIVGTPIDTAITILDRFIEPGTQRRSLTFRVNMSSSSLAITKEDAATLRLQMMQAIELGPEYQLRAGETRAL